MNFAGSLGPPREAIDIVQELAYWRGALKDCVFYETGTPFSRYERSFKFAYDMYLTRHEMPMDELLCAIEPRYSLDLIGPERLRWTAMEELVRSVWLRLQVASPVRPKARCLH